MIQTKRKEPLPGEAAERKRIRILSKALKTTSFSFLKKLNFKEGMKGLDLNCGEGEITLKILDKIGSSGSVTGLESNTSFIQTAVEKAVQLKKSNVTFQSSAFSDLASDKSYDFIYSRFLLSQTNSPSTLLAKIFNKIKQGGFLMMEDLDFSHFQCFPYCFAFDRFVELYIETSARKGNDIKIGSKLMLLLQQAGFENIQVHQASPFFLKDEEKCIASLSLESISDDLLNQKIINSTELQSLLLELKTFEKQKSTMISLPGIYQVWAFKK